MGEKACKKTMMVIAAMMVVLGPLAAGSQAAAHLTKPAAKVNTRWEHKADRNRDGYVDPHEADKAKKDYIKHKSRVNTAWEHRADRNHDGHVGPHEAARIKELGR